MILVFVSGPIAANNTWLRERNIRRAEEVALELLEYGYSVFCPHTMTRFFEGALPPKVFYRADLEVLRRCDAVLLVPGWEDSNGSREELREANRRGIPAFTDLNVLKMTLPPCGGEEEGT